MSSSLLAIRASSEAGSAEQKRQQERRRNILVLINHHLIEHGYVEAAERLQHEAGLVMSRFEVADNMDLGLILGDYESYYEMRFDKKPKMIRKLKDGEETVGRPGKDSKGWRPPVSSSGGVELGCGGSGNASASGKRQGGCKGGGQTKLPNVSGAVSHSYSSGPENEDPPPAVALEVVCIRGRGSGELSSSETATAKFEDRILKPPPQFGGDQEMKQLAAIISREIYQDSPNVFFDDIVALDEAKRLLCEAVQLPLRFPALFTGLLRPWKGILLHGPPGTGKTLLARAVATECSTTFFNISASTLVSKWRGDSEKLVRALFELARYHAPSTVFLDEIDSILGSRGGEGQEHEASRRMKTELLIQMDGMIVGGNKSQGSGSGAKASQQVFVMAASNMPWDLDVALLRRLEKRVLVPLPIKEAREAMLRKHLSTRASSDVDYGDLAARLDGYSGADLELVCREAAMKPVRRIMEKLKNLDYHGVGHSGHGTAIPEPPPPHPRGGVGAGTGAGAGSQHRAPRAAHSSNSNTNQADADNLLKADPVNFSDVLAALDSTKPSSDGNVSKYAAWQAEFGAV